MNKTIFLIVFHFVFLLSCENNPSQKEALSKQFDEIIINNASESLAELKNGNKRFLKGEAIHINYHEQIEQTKHGYEPHAAILSCMDYRVPPEIVFDQGIGNIFVIRNAGNLEDHNVLGSLEYTVHHSTAKLIVVMGHSHCGAITGAVNDIKHGHLSQLVEQIKPSIKAHKSHPHVINQTAKHSVEYTINDILERSKTIRDMVKENKIAIVGAYYDVETGKVIFL